jgi:hypothetical protein
VKKFLWELLDWIVTFSCITFRDGKLV